MARRRTPTPATKYDDVAPLSKRRSENRKKRGHVEPKPHEQRDWRDNWNEGDWWEAWSYLWFAITCAREATREIADRDYCRSVWDRANTRLKLAVDLRQRLIDDLPDTGAMVPPQDLTRALSAQIDREDRALAELDNLRSRCAFDSETVESATLRRMLERGTRPYAWAKVCNPRLPSEAIADTTEKRTAQNKRAHLLDYYKRTLEQYLDLLEDDRLGYDVFRPIGEPFSDHHKRVHRSRFETRRDLEREIERVRRSIDSLTPQ